MICEQLFGLKKNGEPNTVHFCRHSEDLIFMPAELQNYAEDICSVERTLFDKRKLNNIGDV